jgi:hypothetical protein
MFHSDVPGQDVKVCLSRRLLVSFLILPPSLRGALAFEFGFQKYLVHEILSLLEFRESMMSSLPFPTAG